MEVEEVDGLEGVPEPIALAERWRQAGKIIAARSPESMAELYALLATWVEAVSDAESRTIDSVYRNT